MVITENTNYRCYFGDLYSVLIFCNNNYTLQWLGTTKVQTNWYVCVCYGSTGIYDTLLKFLRHTPGSLGLLSF